MMTSKIWCEAQRRKLDFHLAASGASRARHILDIGCGWGSLLERALRHQGIESATGLTLSDAQLQYIRARGDARIDVRKESWIDHAPAQKYDSIVSIGALEHFASPGDSPREKIGLYREFFAKCRSWLRLGGAMSLQTIAYGTMRPEENNAFISHPDLSGFRTAATARTSGGSERPVRVEIASQ